MFTRPAMPPLPPPDGAFRRVRRRALLRRLRGPSAAIALVALVAVSFGVTRPHPTSSLEPVTSTPTATESYSPAPETTPPSPVATATATTAPTVEPTTPPPSETSSPPITYYAACAKGGSGRTGPDVTGVVVDRAGHPVPNASVTGRACTGDGGTIDGAVVARTDTQGQFHYACLGDAWAVVAPFAWYTGVRSTSADVGFAWLGGSMYARVPCGSDYHVVLPNAATVHAHLVDKYGNPASVAGHDWLDLMDADDEVTPFYIGHWSADGTTSFTGLAPGRYFFYESPHKYIYFDVAEGQTVDVDVPYGTVTPTSAPPTSDPPTSAPPSESATPTP